MMTARGNKQQNQDIAITAVIALAVGLLGGWFLFDADDNYQTGVEVGRQMILEATEGEPGYCANKFRPDGETE